MGMPAHESDDVFALGVIWNELLRGQLGSGPPIGRVWIQRRREFQRLGLSSEQLDLLGSCLEPSREYRIQDAAELSRLIRDAYGTLDEHCSPTPDPSDALRTCGDGNASLSSLTSLPVVVAEALSRWDGARLPLNGIKSLSVEAVTALANWSGRYRLSLNGLKSLSVECATAIARWRGDKLSLSGLKSLSVGVAEALAQWEGDPFSLFGMDSIPIDTAMDIVRWRGAISLDGLE